MFVSIVLFAVNVKIQEIFESEPHISNYLMEQRTLYDRIQLICESMEKSRASDGDSSVDSNAGAAAAQSNNSDSAYHRLLKYFTSEDNDSHEDSD